MTISEHETIAAFEDLVKRCIEEDLGPDGDPTGRSAGQAIAEARVVAREAGVLAGISGLEVMLEAFVAHLGSDDFIVEKKVSDGQPVYRGAEIVYIKGPAATLLAAERTVLNVIGHLSGIATLTSRFVTAVAGNDVAVRDTRKTTPGLRKLEKYAVRCGGGLNHRMGLYDALLVKDNHVAAFGGVKAAVEAARTAAPDLALEIEVDTLEQLQEALESGCDLILLDNMTPEELSKSVKICDGKALLEASGGITLENVSSIASSGVNYVAIGALTHSARSLDIGLDWEPWQASSDTNRS